MHDSGSRELTALRVALGCLAVDPQWTRGRRCQAGGPDWRRWYGYTRQASPFYAEHYRAVPPGPIGPEVFYQLPPATKPELMARFDDWVTDPSVTRAGVEDFVANLDNLGRDFFGLLVQDRRAVAVMTGVSYVRALGALTPRLVAQMPTRQPRQAAVFAGGGHF